MKKITYVLIIIIFIMAIFLIVYNLINKDDDYEAINTTKYDIAIDLDTDNMSAKVSQKVSYYNNTNMSLNHILFNLYPFVYSQESENLPVENIHVNKTYYNGISYGGINILRVENTNKEKLEFDINNQLLLVHFDELASEEYIDIIIRYHLYLPEINHRFGYNQHTINLANFYPQVAIFENGSFRQDSYYAIGDPFYSEMADYRVSIKTPIEYTVATSAKLINQYNNVTTKTLFYEGNRIRDFAIVLSNHFSVIQEKTNGIEIYYYYYKDSNPEDSINTAIEAILLYSDMIGKYPYDIFSIVETEFVYGGMEYSQLIMLASYLAGQERERVIIHETAHQWWYNIVGSNSIDSAWMDEGLTEFTTLLYYTQKGRDNMREEIVNLSTQSYIRFNENRLILEDKTSNRINRSLNQFMTEYEYVIMVYCKGMLLFNSIYEIIGHDKFIKAIRLYYEENKFSIAQEQDLIEAFCAIDARGLEYIFNAWLEGYVVIISPYN